MDFDLPSYSSMDFDLPSDDNGMEISLPDSDSGVDLMLWGDGSADTVSKKPAGAAPMKRAAVKKRPAAAKDSKKQKCEQNAQKGSKKGKKAEVITYSDFQQEMDLLIGDPEMPQTLKEKIYATMVEEQTTRDDVIEVFSVPRLLQPCANVGLRLVRSMDILNGWDLSKPNVQINCFNEFRARKPKIAVLSPPCTMFSMIMDSNWNRMTPDKRSAKLTEAIALLDMASWIMDYQIETGNYFVFEHPAGAKSWAIGHGNRGAIIIIDMGVGQQRMRNTMLYQSAPPICAP